MLSTNRKRTTSRLTLGLASFATAIALALAMAFGAPASASAVDNPTIGGPIAVQAPESERKAATVLVYLNGSDLESEAGAASADINEMLASGIGANANVVIETLGTKEWQEHGIASDHTQRYLVDQGQLKLVDDSLAQLDTTAPDTLADFISWGVKNYPADRYMLILWDHGAGPVYGFGVDEFQDEGEALTLDEMREALSVNKDVHFDFIGMDCCIMSSLETYYVLSPYCDYAILSEDFEPGSGWSYENWMALLEENPTASTEEFGTAIVDDMIAASEEDVENGGDATLALVDESAVPALYNAWIAFAYENEDALLGTSGQEGSQHSLDGLASGHIAPMRPGGHGDFGSIDWDVGPSSHGHHDMDGYHDMWDEFEGYFDYDDYGYGFDYDEYLTMSDYYATDIMVAASSAGNDKAAALKRALDKAIVHFGSTSGETDMAGMAVTLPYGDAEFYDELVDVFTGSGIDADYIAWLEGFVNAEGAGIYSDFDGLRDAPAFHNR